MVVSMLILEVQVLVVEVVVVKKVSDTTAFVLESVFILVMHSFMSILMLIVMMRFCMTMRFCMMMRFFMIIVLMNIEMMVV